MNDFNARDLFAGLAMVGFIMKSPFESLDRDEGTPVYDNIAFSAYEYADAMLKEKEKRDGQGG